MTDDARNDLRGDPAMRPAGGRDQADIAQLLRALNDDLADADPPAAQQRRVAGRAPVGETPVGDAAGAYGTADGGYGSAQRRRTQGRPSIPLVAVAVVAAAGIGFSSFFWAPASRTGGAGDDPPPLIERAGGDRAAVASPHVADAPPPAPVVISPSQIPPASLGTSPRMLTPGQTATVVRPTPDPIDDGAATVVVQPPAAISAPPASAAPPAISAPPASAAPPAPPAPRVVAPRPASPAVPPQDARPQTAPPAQGAPPNRTAAAAEPIPGGPGRWAIQVGTFSVAANAEQLARRLSQGGRKAYVVEWRDRQGREWKAVRVGNFTGEAAARAAVGDIRTQLNLNGQLIDLR